MALNWNRLSVRVDRALRTRCEPGWRIDEAWNRRLHDFDLFFIFKGKGTLSIDGQISPLRPGVCLWLRPGKTYHMTQDGRDRLGVNAIHFSFRDSKGRTHNSADSLRRANLGDVPPVVQHVRDIPYVDALMHRIIDLVRMPIDQASDIAQRTADLLMHGMLMDLDTTSELILSLDPVSRKQYEWVTDLAAQINENPVGTLSVASMADQAGYSINHFTRIFRRHLGVTPRDYLVRARIDRACHLLLESNLTLEKIAAMLGYADVYFFSRQFKQKTGQAPGHYRRHHRS